MPGGTTTWRFSTVAAAPSSVSSSDRSPRRVGGASARCKAAIDAIPGDNDAPARITIDAGVYHEIVHFASKSQGHAGRPRSRRDHHRRDQQQQPEPDHVDALGRRDRRQQRRGDRHAHHSQPHSAGRLAGRGLAPAVRATSAWIRNASITSLQDTILWSGRLVRRQLLHRGQRRFRLGNGRRVLQRLRAQERWSRAGCDRPGAEPGVDVRIRIRRLADSPRSPAVTRARCWHASTVSQYPASHVAYINCQMGSSHRARRLDDHRRREHGASCASGSTRASTRRGKPVDMSQRASGSTRISASQEPRRCGIRRSSSPAGSRHEQRRFRAGHRTGRVLRGYAPDSEADSTSPRSRASSGRTISSTS